jgi:hypothetical protein
MRPAPLPKQEGGALCQSSLSSGGQSGSRNGRGDSQNGGSSSGITVSYRYWRRWGSRARACGLGTSPGWSGCGAPSLRHTSASGSYEGACRL